MKITVSRITILLVTTFTVVLLTASHVRAQPTTSINVTEISITPSTIDTTSGTQNVTMTIHVTDTERDIRVVHVYLRSPLGTSPDFTFLPGDRISGNARDGIYRRTFTLWRYAEAGIWIVNYIYIIDGSDPYYRWREFNTSYLAARGLLIQLQVINNNEADPPELTDFNAALSTINGSRSVTVTLRAKDSGSGIRYLAVAFSNPGDCAFTYNEPCDGIGSEFGNPISGDEKDGVYRVSFDIPADFPPGTYGATLRAIDGVDNSTWLRYPAQLQLSAVPFVSISGRVLTPDGHGLRNATVSITDSQGVRRTVTTSSFGLFSFDNVGTGGAYLVSVASRLYRFNSQTVQIGGNLTLADFVGLE